MKRGIMNVENKVDETTTVIELEPHLNTATLEALATTLNRYFPYPNANALNFIKGLPGDCVELTLEKIPCVYLFGNNSIATVSKAFKLRSDEIKKK